MNETIYYKKRKAKGYTQEFVAEKVDISVSTYQRLEKGGNVGIKIVEKVEKLLDILKK